MDTLADSLTLDQLRMFIAVVEEGSFSAAGRRLRRVQSAVSHAMANLEAQLEVTIWNRKVKRPTLTREGELLLIHARRVCLEVAALKQTAVGLTGGLEASIAIAIDALFPLRGVVDLARLFAAKFPSVQLKLHTETLAGVAALVSDSSCQLGIVGPAVATPGLERRHLATVQMVTVAAATHPLASMRRRISSAQLADHVHVVLSERNPGQPTPDQAVLSPRSWRIADLSTKRALILAGLGWGNLPRHMIERDLASKRLVRIRPEAWADDEWNLALSTVIRAETPRGPATQWLLDQLPVLCARSPGVER
jgi:DNA-binding transcriptional LysR family regulator